MDHFDDILNINKQRIANIYKSFSNTSDEDDVLYPDDIIKGGKGKPIGTISTHGGKKVIKTAQGWRPYKGSTSGKNASLNDELHRAHKELASYQKKPLYQQDPAVVDGLKQKIAMLESDITHTPGNDPDVPGNQAHRKKSRPKPQKRTGQYVPVHPDSGMSTKRTLKSVYDKDHPFAMSSSAFAKLVTAASKGKLEEMRADLNNVSKQLKNLTPAGKALIGTRIQVINQELQTIAQQEGPKNVNQQAGAKAVPILDAIAKHAGHEAQAGAEELQDPSFVVQMTDEDVRGMINGMIDEGYVNKSEGARILHELGHKKADIAKDLGMHYSHVYTATKGVKAKQTTSSPKPEKKKQQKTETGLTKREQQFLDTIHSGGIYGGAQAEPDSYIDDKSTWPKTVQSLVDKGKVFVAPYLYAGVPGSLVVRRRGMYVMSFEGGEKQLPPAYKEAAKKLTGRAGSPVENAVHLAYGNLGIDIPSEKGGGTFEDKIERFGKELDKLNVDSDGYVLRDVTEDVRKINDNYYIEVASTKRRTTPQQIRNQIWGMRPKLPAGLKYADDHPVSPWMKDKKDTKQIAPQDNEYSEYEVSDSLYYRVVPS